LAGSIIFGLVVRQKHHSGRAQWSKAAHHMAAREERERERKRERQTDRQTEDREIKGW
jgi:hypothetical protein